MKRLLFSVLALTLLTAVPAAAASNDHHRHRGNPQDQTTTQSTQGGTVIQDRHKDSGTVERRRHRVDRIDRADRRERNNRRDNDRRRDVTRFNLQLHNQGIEPRRERPRDWNVRPRNFDRNLYRRNYESSHRFHWRGYVRPRGWYAHRWTYGERLPRAFWARDYWINDWWSFDLRTPPYGYEWVRYGDDALLVNIYTGEVLEVAYDLFD